MGTRDGQILCLVSCVLLWCEGFRSAEFWYWEQRPSSHQLMFLILRVRVKCQPPTSAHEFSGALQQMTLLFFSLAFCPAVVQV